MATKTLPMTISSDNQHAVIRFDSFGEYVDYFAADKGYLRSWDRSFVGVSSKDEAEKLARTGLPREGGEALHVAADRGKEMDRELIKPQFVAFNDVQGADVDVALFLDGEPECMINFMLM